MTAPFRAFDVGAIILLLLWWAGQLQGAIPAGDVDRRTPVPAREMRADLAGRLQVPPAAVDLAGFERVMWPDGCAGVYTPGAVCSQAVMPGYVATLAVGEREYRYHGVGAWFLAVDFFDAVTIGGPLDAVPVARSAIHVIADEPGPPSRVNE